MNQHVQRDPDEQVGEEEVRDARRARNVEIVRAWERDCVNKANNRADREQNIVPEWEITSIGAAEGRNQEKVERMEERFAQERAKNLEMFRNELSEIHRQATSRIAGIETRRLKEILRARTKAAGYIATGKTPRVVLGFTL